MANTADIDAVITKCVDDIWTQYDQDNSGALDKEETRAFVRNTLADMSDGQGGFNDEDFEACFQEFDEDGSGQIEKNEMIAFIKKVAGL